MPVPAHQANQLIAFVDRRPKTTAIVANAIHKQRFDIWLELAQDRVVMDEVIPRIEPQQRLDRASRTRINRDDLRGLARASQRTPSRSESPSRSTPRRSGESRATLRHDAAHDDISGLIGARRESHMPGRRSEAVASPTR